MAGVRIQRFLSAVFCCSLQPLTSVSRCAASLAWLDHAAGILFSHPADFTPVCTTELGTVAKYVGEFTKRNMKLCAIRCGFCSLCARIPAPIFCAISRHVSLTLLLTFLLTFSSRFFFRISCDDVDSHVEWIKDICASQGCAELGFPIIADPSREIITQLGMIDPEERNAAGLPMPARAVRLFSPPLPHRRPLSPLRRRPLSLPRLRVLPVRSAAARSTPALEPR